MCLAIPSRFRAALKRVGGGSILGLLLAWLALGLRPAALHAQEYADWQDGTIVLYNGDTISGRLFLNQNEDLMEMEINGTIKTYTAQQILLARFYDPPRLFASHPAALRGTMEVPSFFEVLYPGAYATLLSRERVGMNNTQVVDQYGQTVGTFYGNEMKRDFFILNARGRVRRMPLKRQDLARLLEPDPPAVMLDYIKRNKPDPTSDVDMIAWIAFYNHYKSELPGAR